LRRSGGLSEFHIGNLRLELALVFGMEGAYSRARAYGKVDKLFVRGTDAVKASAAIEVTIEALKAVDTNKSRVHANLLGYVADFVDPQRKVDRHEKSALQSLKYLVGEKGLPDEAAIQEASAYRGVPVERLRELWRRIPPGGRSCGRSRWRECTWWWPRRDPRVRPIDRRR